MKKLILVLFVSLLIFGCEGSRFKKVSAENGIVKIPTKDVSDGEIHYYEMDFNGKMAKFFVIKSADGVIRAAFDACDVCFPEKKGYRQEGDYVVCNNCGQRFHTTKINEVKGGCNPAPLNREYDNSYVSIRVPDIQAGLNYF